MDQESPKILIVGDLLIDKTIFVKATKLSPEAPIPVVSLLPNKPPIESPGGAGLAAALAVKDNIPISFLTACPPSRAKWLKKLGIDTYFHRTIENIYKTRYIDLRFGYHLIRVDTDDITAPPKLDQFNDLISFQDLFRSIIEQENISIVTLLDYRKGVLKNKILTQWIIEECKKLKLPTYIDSRSEDLVKFSGATIIKLNNREFNFACAALNVPSPSHLMEKLNINILLVTKGDEGAECYTRKDSLIIKHSHTASLNNISGHLDVTGCGDVFDITFCYHWGVLGKSSKEALNISVDRATKFAYEPIGGRTV